MVPDSVGWGAQEWLTLAAVVVPTVAVMVTAWLNSRAHTGITNRIDGVDRRVAGVEEGVADVKKSVAEVNRRVAVVEKGVADVNRRVAVVEKSVADVKTSVAAVDKRVGDVDARAVERDEVRRASLEAIAREVSHLAGRQAQRDADQKKQQ